MELSNIASLLVTELHGRNFALITIPELKSFVTRSLELYGTEEKLQKANRVCDILLAMLKKKKQLNDNAQQTFVEVIIAAALLHNLFYDASKMTSLFEAREKLTQIAKEEKVHPNAAEAIFQTIEAQLGDDTPVPHCRPIANSPTELFAWAVWIYNNIINRKRVRISVNEENKTKFVLKDKPDDFAMYVNGLRVSRSDYCYNKETGEVEWLWTSEKGGYDLQSGFEIVFEYGIGGEKCPAQ